MAYSSSENPAQLTPEDETVLASSVALWLENKGYSKVLKRFLSAAQIQDDTWKAKAINLNDIFSKYQESCHKDEKPKASKESKDDEVFEFKADQVTENQKDKKQKKKKSKLNSESLGADKKQIDVVPEVTEEVLETKIIKDKKSKKRSAEAAENVVDESKKASKKRKRVPTDENEKQSGEEAAVEESKSKKSKGLEEGKDAGANGHASELNKEGAINNNGVDKSSQQKSARRQGNISAEPKTVNAFQRVKVDEVEFVDERLQDNSYWAKGGAEIGYGAKAQEILGQVRGRDFRHEKTKKKRGSYRGGQIDLQSHSVKFNYSDEE
ncbi:nucleolar and coiled-body phosphoprotein 1 [Phtheirospermum japonicum]|uniref:Nucleolar and coiled-body phosphoprotein 1 n=1 Tax=Phtheirospermum japonicum TaxID=374723 RepID=A0A830BW33_9LAMI|nr:nucleolar and coiled-body phosphoprotein 1 [Phtheirospermum japonicum]